MSARYVLRVGRLELLDSTPHVVAEAAAALLNGPRVSAAAAATSLPPRAGLYAVFASASAHVELALPPLTAGWPIYIGKAEDSLRGRDAKTHFEVGKTGQSTLRRSIAALLRDQHGLRGQPRNPEKPGYFPNFGLAHEHDELLQAWMVEHLTIATWQKPDDADDADGYFLLRVERALLKQWTPPLNDKDNPDKWEALRKIRKVMADDARAWRPSA